MNRKISNLKSQVSNESRLVLGVWFLEFPAKQGFTLVESLVAITILTVTMSALLFSASRGIIAAQIARDQLTASYLAQEGIEYVRMMRDNSYLSAYHVGGANVSGVSGTAWTGFLTAIASCQTSILGNAPFCTLDPAGSGTLAICPSGVCGPLYLAPTNVYTQSVGGTMTAFTRTIQAIAVPPNEEKIVSTVLWSFHSTTYSVTITDHLTPWQ